MRLLCDVGRPDDSPGSRVRPSLKVTTNAGPVRAPPVRCLDFSSTFSEAPTMTTLGTPLSPHATKVMLLGSGELGKEVLIALQRLGVETLAVDRYDNAPGQQVAHHARTIAMSDPAQLKALIEAERPHLVVPEIEAIATPMLEELEAAGTVRVIPTARAARLTMDREGIRRLAAETLGLPTSPYKFCDSLAELQAAIEGENGVGIGYPCIVKPVMSSSGKGQSKIDGPADVQKAWDYAMAGGRVSHGRVIVEGFVDFDYEITLLTVRAVGNDGNVQTQFCEPIGHLQVHGDYVESWQPARTTRAWSRCARSTRANLSCTPAPSSACRWTPACATPAPAPSSTAAWRPQASCSTGWKKPCACQAPTCACSASPRASPSAAWAWRWRARATWRRRGAMRSWRPARSNRARRDAKNLSQIGL